MGPLNRAGPFTMFAISTGVIPANITVVFIANRVEPWSNRVGAAIHIRCALVTVEIPTNRREGVVRGFRGGGEIAPRVPRVVLTLNPRPFTTVDHRPRGELRIRPLPIHHRI